MTTVRTLLACALVAGAFAVASCSRGSGAGDETRTVVLYSSVDDYVLDEVIRDFERETGIEVLLVGDTEATKTTGLVTRLLAEADDPSADVWWSSEPFGTIMLSEAGALHSSTGDAIIDRFEDWRGSPRSGTGTWVGIAQRARVIAYSTGRVETPPRRLAELTDEAWNGRVGMARPQFGTTRGHMAALHHEWGEDAFVLWLDAMKTNGLRLYDGNATVVRKIAEGEIDVGLTDTDDVWVAHRNGWAVDFVFEENDGASGVPGDESVLWPSFGPMVIPNTVSLVNGAPNPDEGRELVAYLLSGAAERVLRSSDSRNYPVRAGIAPHPEAPPPAHPAALELEAVAQSVDRAMDACARVLD